MARNRASLSDGPAESASRIASNQRNQAATSEQQIATALANFLTKADARSGFGGLGQGMTYSSPVLG